MDYVCIAVDPLVVLPEGMHPLNTVYMVHGIYIYISYIHRFRTT